MKDLQIVEQEKIIRDISDIDFFEKQYGVKFPDSLKKFLLKYDGAMVKGTCFNGAPTFKEILNLNKHPVSASIEEILKGHQSYGYKNFIPFAIDSGGWDYDVSISPETYGQVWVNKFDSGEENPFEFVRNSFEEFIDSLESEE